MANDLTFGASRRQGIGFEEAGMQPKMNEDTNVEDVEQSETNEARSLTAKPPESLEECFGIGDADTAEGQARRAEEAHLKEMEDDTDKVADLQTQFEELSDDVEDMESLPSPKEAEMGELCRVPNEGSQFEELEIVGGETPDLIGVIIEDDSPKGATDQEVREAVEAVEGGDN